MIIFDIRPPDWNWREWFAKNMNKYTISPLAGDIGWHCRPRKLIGGAIITFIIFAALIFAASLL